MATHDPAHVDFSEIAAVSEAVGGQHRAKLEERLEDWTAPVHDDWKKLPPAELIDHIVAVHHNYLRGALPRLAFLIEHVSRAHAAQHGELQEVKETFDRLHHRLDLHMGREELQVFPLIRYADQERTDHSGYAAGVDDLPQVVRDMNLDGRESLADMSQLRTLTRNYTPPEDACSTYLAMLDALAELEADLRMHVHKERDALFPAALQHHSG